MNHLTLFLCCLFLTSCGPSADASVEKAEAESVELEGISGDLPADFPAFYQQFHADSTFQKVHIQWPLQGVPDRPLQEGEQFYYTPETWKIQRIISPASGYQSAFTVIGEDMVIEKIVNAKDRTTLERRFIRSFDGEWMLIYYQGVRKVE